MNHVLNWALASKEVLPQGDAYWNLKEKEVTKHNATVPGLVMSLSCLWNLHACWQKSFRAENGMVQLSNHVMFLTSEQKIECCSFPTISLFLTSERSLLSVNNIMAGSGNIEPTSPTIVYIRGSYSVGAKDISKAQFNSLFKEFS